MWDAFVLHNRVYVSCRIELWVYLVGKKGYKCSIPQIITLRWSIAFVCILHIINEIPYWRYTALFLLLAQVPVAEIPFWDKTNQNKQESLCTSTLVYYAKHCNLCIQLHPTFPHKMWTHCSVAILWSCWLNYVGQVLDIYKQTAGSCYSLVDDATSSLSMSYLALRVYLPLQVQLVSFTTSHIISRQWQG